MLDLARDIIGSQPILTIFLAIGLGYLVGQITVAGFALGVGAVLFVGLAIGAFAPKAQIVGPIGLTGLIMFLYGIGILYGRQFFEGMVGVGRKYNLLALVACIASLFVALGLGKIFGVKIGHTLGIYAGSMTSTAALQAALDVVKSKDPSIGYSIANMGTFSMAILGGGALTVGDALYNLLYSTAGNVVGGALFVGIPFTYLNPREREEQIARVDEPGVRPS